jgi:hypothetical protein
MRSAADSANQSPDLFPDFLSKKHNEARWVVSQEIVFSLAGKRTLTCMRQICGNCCGKGGHIKAADFLTAISLDFQM